MKCYICKKQLGVDVSSLFGGLCFKHAMEKKSLQERYPQLAETIEKCYGCKYFGQVFNINMISILILEELCSHPLETYGNYTSCFIEKVSDE